MAYKEVHDEHFTVDENGIVHNLSVVKEISFVNNEEKSVEDDPNTDRKILLHISYDGMHISDLALEASRKSVIDLRGRFRDRTDYDTAKRILSGMEEMEHPKTGEDILTTEYRVASGTEAFFEGPKSMEELEKEIMKQANQAESAEELDELISKLEQIRDQK
jgi:hypothetical protein